MLVDRVVKLCPKPTFIPVLNKHVTTGQPGNRDEMGWQSLQRHLYWYTPSSYCFLLHKAGTGTDLILGTPTIALIASHTSPSWWRHRGACRRHFLDGRLTSRYPSILSVDLPPTGAYCLDRASRTHGEVAVPWVRQIRARPLGQCPGCPSTRHCKTLTSRGCPNGGRCHFSKGDSRPRPRIRRQLREKQREEGRIPFPEKG